MPTRIRFLTVTMLCLAAAALTLSAPARAQLVEGKDYRPLTPPRPTSSPGKVEVVEFFSYACPHCAKFNPLVSAWVAKQPKDVAFKRVAVSYGRPPWMNLSRTYYALESTGDLKKLDAALFRAIHDDHQNLFDEQSIADWVGKEGGDATRFANAYVSFGVNNQTVQADQMAEDFGIDAIPTLAVNGRYVVISPTQAADEEQTFRELLVLTDKVIAMARAAAPRTAAPAAGKAPATRGP
ncbi:MAG TPA: thiol:disulfide interchange protein DsbA/DsbL [Steroidobacteraceae bacterium]|nr:thiol:disulfide interchange protein DsbA/DsbL [Steroidobacteraceae bacterium]